MIGPTKCVILPFVAIALICIQKGHGQCSSGQEKIKVTIVVEHQQHSVVESADYEKRVTSTSLYKSKYRDVSASASISGSYGGFSAAAEAAFSKVNSDVQSSKNDSEVVKSVERKYNPGFLQLYRQVSTTVEIAGSVAKTIEKNIIDSVEHKEQLRTTAQLRKESEDYLKLHNRIDSGITSGGRQALYSESVCIGR